MGYIDRRDAGIRLAKALRHLRDKNTVVLALPRGGIVLGAEVAKELQAPLGLILVRKIGYPSYSEYAIGAVAEGEQPIYNQDDLLGVDSEWLRSAEAAARQLIKRRRLLYYGEDIAPQTTNGKVVIVVDDGIATGLTMEAAVRALRNQNAKRIIVAVPIAPRDCIDRLEALADEVVVLDKPETFLGAVGSYYQNFEQVEDDEVKTILWEVNDYVQKTNSKHHQTARIR
jgi:putative phosphoribosyl transferase